LSSPHSDTVLTELPRLLLISTRRVKYTIWYIIWSIGQWLNTTVTILWIHNSNICTEITQKGNKTSLEIKYIKRKCITLTIWNIFVRVCLLWFFVS
jgi:hypothetical protein